LLTQDIAATAAGSAFAGSDAELRPGLWGCFGMASGENKMPGPAGVAVPAGFWLPMNACGRNEFSVEILPVAADGIYDYDRAIVDSTSFLFREAA